MWAVGRLSLLSSGRQPAVENFLVPATPPVAARGAKRAEVPELAPAPTVVAAPRAAAATLVEIATPAPDAAPTFLQRVVRKVTGLFRSLFR